MASTETLTRLGKKREALENLVSSRKRKLQELYRVVNHVQLSCTTPNRGRSASKSGWDDDGERQFLEDTDINQGKTFNANEMIPKPILVVPDAVREALKPIVPTTAQNGDAGLSLSSTKAERSTSENPTTGKSSEALNVPRARDTSVRRSMTPKPAGVDGTDSTASVVEESGTLTPARRSVRQRQPSAEPTARQEDIATANNSDETGSKRSGTPQALVPSNDSSSRTDQEMEDATSAIPEEVEDASTSERTSDSARSQGRSSPTHPSDKSVSPSPLQRSSSQKSESPILAISTQTSPQEQIPRPFPTPTTATELEHNTRPPTSVSNKSVSPPSPADSAVPDEAGSEKPVDENLKDDILDSGDGDKEKAEDVSEMEPESLAKASETQAEPILPSEIAESELKSSQDEVMGEVEKQLQVETALSKQQETSKEGDIPSTQDSQIERVENDIAKPLSKESPGDVEMEDADAQNTEPLEKEQDGEAAEVEVEAQVPKISTNSASETSRGAIDSSLGSQETPGVQSTEESNLTNKSIVSAKQETFDTHEGFQSNAEHAVSPAPETVRETGIATSNIKREEQTPLEALESLQPTHTHDQKVSATPAGIPPTPQNITHEADAIDGSAIAETPMSVDDHTIHLTSPKSVQQPLTTAALESINTTVSTPATRASSRREKRPSITGGLQLAKIVFHGRSTAGTSASKADGNPNELSPSAPTPARVGTRSGSISTPARMNSRSLEAQRILSHAELRDQHQMQGRQQGSQHKNGSDKPRLDVFDYLTAVTASEPLQNSLATSHKTLSTSAFQLLRREKQAIQALTEIQDLQKAGKWSLTQPAKAIEPPKQMVHWDYLLMEVKWMSKDFKEDRKWNIVKAKKLADSCVAWHHATPDQKKAMRIRTTRDSSFTRNRHVTQVPTPDLMPSDEHSDDDAMRDDDDDGDEHMRDDFVHRLHEVENPGNLFALSADDIVFEILHNSMTDRMLGELPIFEAPKIIDANGKLREAIFFDGWKNNEPLGPASGLKRTLWETPVEEGPPAKKSRFSYDPEYRLLDSDDEDDDNREPIRRIGIGSRGIARSGSPVLQPENTTVALFNPDFQPVLQRLHNAHPFRPPQEMPPATFFEYRAPSQWTAEEDKELVSAVRKYNHNWWLVSQVMQPRSFLQSGADRRSLWECFERWFMLDPQNQELIKGPFFKPVQQRLELASRAPTHANAAQQQAANTATAATPGGPNATPAASQSVTVSTPGQPPKRRTSQPMRVERRRNTRTLNMIEQMRKLAKKREVQASKQAQSTSIAIKKQQEQSAQAAAAPKSEPYTPLQVSRMKHERELLHRQQAQMQQMAQIQRRQAQAQAAQGGPTAPGTAAGAAGAAAGATPAATTGVAATPTTTAPANTTTSTPTSATPSQTNNNIPVQSRNNLQVPGVQSTPAAAVPTTAQQSLLAAQQQRSLMAAANNSAAVQAATQQVNQHLRAQGHTVASNGQNGPTSLTPEQYRMLIQARMQANALKLQQVQAQASAAAAAGVPGTMPPTAGELAAMRAAAAARAHNSNSIQAAGGSAGGANVPTGRELISPQQAMMRIKQHFPTIGDEYVHRMIMQHQAQAKQLGKELTYGHISNLIASLASQFQGAAGQAANVAQQQQQQVQIQQAQQQQVQQQQAAAAAAAAAHHHQQGHGQSPPHPGVVGAGHVGAGGIHHPHPPISRGGGSATTQQMLNQLMMSQTRAPSSSPMMGNATPVMSSAGVVSRGSSATPMQRGGSYHTPTPGPNGPSAGGMGQQGSPRVGQSQMGGGS